MPAHKNDMLIRVEQIVLDLISSLVSNKKVTLKVPQVSREWLNHLDGRGPRRACFNGFLKAARKTVYNCRTSRHRFCLIVYLLAEVHCLHLTGGSCTTRGLYYRDTQLVRSQSYIVAAKLDVCRMLNTAPINLGILSASKGLITGDIKLLMSNGDVLDCNVYCGAIALPTDFENVDQIVTTAEMVLVVEKESVFESLVSSNAMFTFGLRFILLTGKGYPDYSTRRMVHRLSAECSLPVYILVDADPFGIEIMLVYQLGSQAMSFYSRGLATPNLRWIGLHPSEIDQISKRPVPLTQNDNKKIKDILSRPNISEGVRHELCRMQQVQLKAEIESVIEILSPLYIPTKINRNLFI